MSNNKSAPWNFRMCKYCGQRIERGFNRWGRECPDGEYHSKDCADAVHGFDNKIESERNYKTVSFDLRRHDQICGQTLAPDEALMLSEDGDTENHRRISVPTEAEIMDAAEEIDPRLPGILAGIKKGRTQKSISRGLGITEMQVSRLLVRLRKAIA